MFVTIWKSYQHHHTVLYLDFKWKCQAWSIKLSNIFQHTNGGTQLNDLCCPTKDFFKIKHNVSCWRVNTYAAKCLGHCVSQHYGWCWAKTYNWREGIQNGCQCLLLPLPSRSCFETNTNRCPILAMTCTLTFVNSFCSGKCLYQIQTLGNAEIPGLQ